MADVERAVGHQPLGLGQLGLGPGQLRVVEDAAEGGEAVLGDERLQPVELVGSRTPRRPSAPTGAGLVGHGLTAQLQGPAGPAGPAAHRQVVP